MIEITRSRTIAASAAAIFALLAEPANLAGMLPRVRKVDILSRGDNQARIATHMAFGPFGTIRNEGEARWETDREVTFVSRSPVLVETRWTLVPDGAATCVQAQIRLDLAPLIGPLAAFVPSEQVITMVAPELDAALDALARKLQQAPGARSHEL